MCDGKHNTAKTALVARLGALDEVETRGVDDRTTVALDQQLLGRLSRMDALQRQAMAEANARRREGERRRIRAALVRINEGEYGFCTECGEDINPERLQIDPSIPTCLSCARG